MSRTANLSLLLLLTIFIASCKRTPVDKGVSYELAQNRKAQVADIAYSLHFNIPEQKDSLVSANAAISFTLENPEEVVLDFRVAQEMVVKVMQGGSEIKYRFENGHIVIPKRYINAGENTIYVEFVSPDGSLNRSNEFLYTLLVPDRASTVFPCFDQPDLKATFNLSLNLPAKWTALSNGKSDTIRYTSNTEKRMTFETTEPISTYLFAFAVGNFKVETQSVNGRTFSLYHRETDKEKLEKNLPDIFSLHAQSLDWLEEYTGIPYPFGKLNFILIPGFQYSGMEHPGAIYYRDSRLLLESNPSINQQLNRANLIAHEVAHQWFGNLVTMRWFNDVWLKEVFAGFMADLMVNPQYPDLNHRLRFLLSHFPRAYSVDRTQGANPIVQQLNNMLNAGTIYGDIIYHKAPIMMQQLEMLMGAEAFKDGVKEYLQSFHMSNANWNELVDILNKHTQSDLKDWANTWTLKTGRPLVKYNIDNENETIKLKALDRTPLPKMRVDASNFNANRTDMRIWLDTLPTFADMDATIASNKPIAFNSSGLGYGCFVPDSLTLKLMLANPQAIKNPTARASAHISMYEMFLEGLIKLNDYTDFLLKAIAKENEPQIQEYLLSSLKNVFWIFSSPRKREGIATDVENTLWKLVSANQPIEQRRSALKATISLFTTNESFSRLHTAWNNEEIYGIELSESDRTKLAFELMIRKPELYHAIAFGEIERMDNPDRIAKFEFLLNAASPIPSQRIDFFESLKEPSRRKPEPWVVEALRLLHHPLRSDLSIRFIEPSLDMLPEIQETGDIFFPLNWLNATLSGHSSPEAAEIVEEWLKAHPDLSPNLKMKLMQSADMLFRANKNNEELHISSSEQII
ncbi:MAG: M1 family metallopeptidase [Bacteroidales bacterium]